MAKVPVIDIRPRDLETVREILRRHVPNHEVLAFGSRSKRTARRHSDLGLAIRSDEAIPTDIIYAIKNELSESRLPMMVDVLDMASVSEKFRGVIEEEYAVVQRAGRSGWRNTKLGDICRINPDSRDSDWDHEVIQYIDISSVGSGIFNESPKKIPIGEAPSRAKRLVAKGDTIVSTVRPNRRSFMFLNSPSSDTVASTGFAVLRARRDVADPRFLYYLVTHQEFTDYLVSRTEGSAYPAVNPSVFGDADVCVPPLSEQRKIARILGALDDKIELNRRMNQTLEAMAQAIFKSWFVDFDPVRAKAALKRRLSHHSPLEGESARRGRKPEVAPVGGKTVQRLYTPHALEKAQTLRQNQPNAENLLWHYLRDKQLDGHKFRRQQPIGPYIADFACMSRKLLIELDGGQHATRHATDQKRERFLRDKGYRVLRFWNREVFRQCLDVLEEIYRALQYPRQPAPDGLPASTPPPGGSDWDKARARAYLAAMDPKVAALFPDEFEDSELGEIPRGWGVATLGDVAEIIKGRSYKSIELKPSDTALVTLKSFQRGGGYRSDGLKPYAGEYKPEQVVKPGELIISYTDVTQAGEIIGMPAIVLPTGEFSTLVASLDVGIVRSKAEYLSIPYLYHTFLTENFRSHIYSYSTGTTVLHLSVKGLPTYRLLMPPKELHLHYKSLCETLLRNESRNYEDSCVLGEVRDTLLPNLLSGKIQSAENNATGKIR